MVANTGTANALPGTIGGIGAVIVRSPLIPLKYSRLPETALVRSLSGMWTAERRGKPERPRVAERRDDPGSSERVRWPGVRITSSASSSSHVETSSSFSSRASSRGRSLMLFSVASCVPVAGALNFSGPGGAGAFTASAVSLAESLAPCRALHRLVRLPGT